MSVRLLLGSAYIIWIAQSYLRLLGDFSVPKNKISLPPRRHVIFSYIFLSSSLILQIVCVHFTKKPRGIFFRNSNFSWIFREWHWCEKCLRYLIAKIYLTFSAPFLVISSRLIMRYFHIYVGRGRWVEVVEVKNRESQNSGKASHITFVTLYPFQLFARKWY